MEAVLLCGLAERGQLEALTSAATADNCALLRTPESLTLLMCAARAAGSPTEAHRGCAQLLLRLSGSDEARREMVSAVDRDGLTALHHAALVDNCRVAEEVLKARIGINARDGRGRTALLLAVEKDNRQTAELLLSAGADTQLRDNAGRSALDVAVSKGEKTERLVKRWLSSKDIHLKRKFKEEEEEVKEFEEVSKASRTKLYSGAFSVVYSTKTVPPDLQVVLRVVSLSPPSVDEATFEAEKAGLEALKKIRHVNVVQHLQSKLLDSVIEIFLERVDGKTIKNLLDDNEMFFIEVQIQKHFRQLASALCYLHSHPNGPIIHRDIRCGNIMVTPGGTLKLIDFGFALPTGTISSTSGSLIGTISHMAPELLSEDSPRYSRRSDMWAVGCVLYTMAARQEPYKGTNMVKLACKIATTPCPKIAPADKFSESLHDLYAQCMKKDPSERITAVGMLFHPALRYDMRHDNDVLPTDEIRKWAEGIPLTLGALQEVIQLLNDSNKKAAAAKVASTTAAITGGVTAIVGFALLIPSLGAALPLVIVGTAVSIAGGAGAATADIVDTVVQGKEFKKASAKITQCKEATQQLIFTCLDRICSSVRLHVSENRSTVNIAESKILIQVLKAQIEGVAKDMKVMELEEAINTIRSKSSQEQGRANREQANPLTEMFRKLLRPLDELLTDIDSTDLSQRNIGKQASNQFNRALQKACYFASRMLRVMLLGSVEDQTLGSLEPLRLLRTAAGSAQIGAEVGSAVARSVAGRVLGIVGSSVFTAIDIGMLAYYSTRLHQARGGQNTKMAEPVECQIEIFTRLLHEAEDNLLTSSWI